VKYTGIFMHLYVTVKRIDVSLVIVCVNDVGYKESLSSLISENKMIH